MHSYLAVVVALVALTLSAQTHPERSSYDQGGQPPKAKTYSAELTQNLNALREAALTDDYAYKQVAYLSDNIGPRPTGWPQTDAAVQYVAGELRKLGLEVHLEEVHVPRWIRGAESAELIEYPGQAAGATQKIVLTALGANTPTPAGGLSAEVVVARSFVDLEALGKQKVSGKIVLFNVPFDTQKAMAGSWSEAYGEAVEYRTRGAKEAASLGAVACLVRSVGGANYRLPHTGHNTAAGIPAGSVTAEDADLITHLATQGKIRMHLVLEGHTGEDTVSYNVIGDLKGSEHPEQVVVVSGHLDSWDLGTGAIDDAAGVAVAMEMAELVHRLGLHPKRTIRVIAWMDEENGGHGHDTYAKDYASEFVNHVAAIESDLGSDHPLGFNAKISQEAAAWLAPVQEVLKPIGANLIRVTSYSPGSDIAPLAQAGVPAFGVIQDGRTYFNYHHTAADTLDKVNLQSLRENAAARPDLLSDPAWRRGIGGVRQYGLVCELEMFSPQVPEFAAVAAAYPEIQFVLPVMGWPLDLTDEGRKEWGRAMRALSVCPNVAVKIFAIECIFGIGWTVPQVRPWILETIDLFGPERCMFASHMPLCTLACSMQELYARYFEMIAGLSSGEREQLLGETARGVYRI